MNNGKRPRGKGGADDEIPSDGAVNLEGLQSSLGGLPSALELSAAETSPLSATAPLRPRSARRAAAISRTASVATCSSLGGEESEADEGFDGAADGVEKKHRFVWTAEMHERFKFAVHDLGVDVAKPQSVRQLMSCDGETLAPTRQNIKSHLQKYRLLMQKRAKQGGSAGGSGDGELGLGGL